MKKIPHTYVIIFCLILISSLLSIVIPSAKAQTWEIFSAFFAGFERSASIIAFILIIGGAFWILNSTHAIEIGVNRFLILAKKTEKYRIIKFIGGVNNLIIASVMIMFSLFGALFGMSEETIAFVLVFIPLSKSMGYDEIVGVSMCFLAAGLGFAGCLLNPFTLGIAQNIAHLKLFSGIEYRILIWSLFTLSGIIFVISYARKIKTKQLITSSLNIDDVTKSQNIPYNPHYKLTLAVLFLTITTLIIGVTFFDWEFKHIAALFFAMGIIIGFIDGNKPSKIATMFIDGCKDILSAALVVALAGGIIVILEDSGIINLILQSFERNLTTSSQLSTLTIMYLLQTFLNAIITSGTAKAAMLMPIFTSVSQIVGLPLQTTVTAFHIGDGFTNLITPTSGVLIAVLSIAKIPYIKWVKFAWKFILFMIILGYLLLLPTLYIPLPGF